MERYRAELNIPGLFTIIFRWKMLVGFLMVLSIGVGAIFASKPRTHIFRYERIINVATLAENGVLKNIIPVVIVANEVKKIQFPLIKQRYYAKHKEIIPIALSVVNRRIEKKYSIIILTADIKRSQRSQFSLLTEAVLQSIQEDQLPILQVKKQSLKRKIDNSESDLQRVIIGIANVKTGLDQLAREISQIQDETKEYSRQGFQSTLSNRYLMSTLHLQKGDLQRKFADYLEKKVELTAKIRSLRDELTSIKPAHFKREIIQGDELSKGPSVVAILLLSLILGTISVVIALFVAEFLFPITREL